MTTFYSILLVVTVAFFTSCNSRVKQEPLSVVTELVQGQPDTTKEFGERFSLVGDFNGDKIVDTVYESYISALTGKETYKTLDNQNWENNIGLVIKNEPVTRLYSTIKDVDTFIVTSNAQQTGLLHYRNVGDLNKDGKDEIGYGIKWADMSNLNTYHILTLKNHQFKELFSFDINESLLYEDEGLFDNSELIELKGDKTIQYKFYSDTGTVEIGEHTFD